MTDFEFDRYGEPRDVMAERAVVGGLLALDGPIPADAGLVPELFWDPQHRSVAAACLTLAAAGKPTDPVTVRAELLRAGERGKAVDPIELFTLMQEGCLPAQLSHHAKGLRELAARRDVMFQARQALQHAANPGSDPYEVAAHLSVACGALSDAGDPIRPVHTTDAEDFLAQPDAYDWLVPGLFERGDRFLITGIEGSGKSVLSRQIAVTTAAGVNPFTGEHVDAKRVLLVDLENGERHLRRALRSLWQQAIAVGRPVLRGMLTVESRPSGIDLTGPEDPAWLRAVCNAVRPELLVIGPLYRMHTKDMNAEEPARLLTHAIDTIRAEHNCAVVIETHSPHGANGTVRPLRPVGSSLFMRWPEFGYGLREKDDESGVMRLVEWRGPRDERDFPKMLARGGEQEWPWQAWHGLTAVESWGGAS